MKPISELKISPWPWNACTPTRKEVVVATLDGRRRLVELALCRAENRMSDAHLIAAAPEMYKCLLEAVEDKCRRCKAEWYGECVTADGKDCEMVARWKSVLAKAAGEVV